MPSRHAARGTMPFFAAFFKFLTPLVFIPRKTMEDHWIHEALTECVRLKELVPWQDTDWAIGRQQTERKKSPLFESRSCPSNKGWRPFLHISFQLPSVTMSWPLHAAPIVPPLAWKGEKHKICPCSKQSPCVAPVKTVLCIQVRE